MGVAAVYSLGIIIGSPQDLYDFLLLKSACSSFRKFGNYWQESKKNK